MTTQLVEITKQRQELAAQQAQLTERTRISRELHDAVAQDLFSLRMLVDGMQQALSASPPMPNAPDLRPSLQIMAETTETLTQEMRALLLALRPLALQGAHLATALSQLAQQYQVRLGIDVRTELADLPLSPPTEDALLRVAQAALSNAARHGHATTIELVLAVHRNMIQMRIVDNGSGFEAQAEQTPQGLGLRLMRERIGELHGTLTMTTQPGQGTQIEILIPQEGGKNDDTSRASR